jgi:hypothetical protein
MTREELKEMRLGICAEYKIKYFAKYTELQASMFLGKNETSTLKRWRKKGKIFPVVDPGGTGIGYFGWQIADMIMGRAQPWDVSLKENSSLGDITSPSEAAPQPGIDVGEKVTPQSASASARRILR